MAAPWESRFTDTMCFYISTLQNCTYFADPPFWLRYGHIFIILLNPYLCYIPAQFSCQIGTGTGTGFIYAFFVSPGSRSRRPPIMRILIQNTVSVKPSITIAIPVYRLLPQNRRVRSRRRNRRSDRPVGSRDRARQTTRHRGQTVSKIWIRPDPNYFWRIRPFICTEDCR